MPTDPEREDVEWLRDAFLSKLWQVHSEWCSSDGPEHGCAKDEIHALAVFDVLLARVSADTSGATP